MIVPSIAVQMLETHSMAHAPENHGHIPKPPSRWTVNGPLVLLLLAVGAALVYRYIGNPLHDPNSGSRVVSPRGDLADDEKSTIAIYDQASVSVVHVTSFGMPRRDRITRNLFKIPEGAGSGFVWSKKGYIVTNYHVIHNAAGGANVQLEDGSVYEASLAGYDQHKDLAVLKIDAPPAKLTPIPIGQSENLQVGQNVFAIGNPFGIGRTLTTGIISGLNREILSITRHPIEGVIQTDAAINPGNSGGPLLDSAGRLIGINTAIFSPSGAYAGVGFAVPVDTINKIVPVLIRDGRIERPGLGITIDSYYLLVEGVLVDHVTQGSAAERAGIRATERNASGQIVQLGDVIVAIDGTQIREPTDLFRVLDKHKVGDKIVVAVLRDEQKLELELTLQALPSASEP